jgi:glucan-binding YG repeat protein
MRKQTKIAAIVSAAALLAIGASMTSFAATGWQEEDGSWVYYNKNGERVADQWEKSGANWFYLGEDGVMVTDALIEYNDQYYYVDSNGAMVTDRWIAIDNEDAGDEDEPDVHWYYFQSNGKALRKGDSHEHIFKKTLPGGKTYAFDSEGRMLYGWVRYSDGERQTGDTAWKDAEYYFGDENDGAMSVGWREIAITDDDSENAQPGDSFWDEDQVRWFYFKSSGKKEMGKTHGEDPVGDGTTSKKVNGKKYGFDEYGRMIADWYYATDADPETASAGNADYTREFMYFSSPEDGARHSKSWFKVVPGYYLHLGKYEDGDDYWYYAETNGKLVASKIKSIKGKKYAFDSYGRMKKGLQLMKVNDNDIEDIIADDDTAHPYDTEDSFKSTAAWAEDNGYVFYYFSNDEDHDGSMKTGNQTVTIDGESFSFKFEKSGSKKGQGVNKVDNDKHKVYMGGMMFRAGSDDKVKILGISGGKVVEYTTSEFLDYAKLKFDDYAEHTNETDRTETKQGYTKDISVKKGATLYSWNNKDSKKDNFVLVNTSGSTVKSGNKKDGDGYKIILDGDYGIKAILVED